LFQRVLELDPDPHTAGWTHVYLARLAEAAGEPEQAREHYQAALRVEGVSQAARAAAEKGLAALQSKSPRRLPD
ncbi:MAG: hypothetical protein ACP5U2_07060, partial [Bryobacteraceae bacterium]